MTDTLSGELAFVFLVSIVDAVVISWLALWWYRRAVGRIISGATGAPAPASPPAVQPSIDVRDEPLPVDLFDTSVPPAAQSVRATSLAWRRLATAYSAAALVFSAVFAAAMWVQLDSAAPAAAASLLWVGAWPVVPALALLLALPWRRSLTVFAVYLAAGAAVVALTTVAGQMVRGSFNSAPVTNVFWAAAQLVATAGVPFLIVALSGLRRVRGVLPMTLAATLVFGLTLMVFRWAMIAAFNVDALRTLVLDLAVSTTSGVAYYGLYMVLALPVGGLVVWMLRRIATAFERKAFSDVQLIVDCWFAIAASEQIATNLAAPFGPLGVGIGIAAFVAYRGTAHAVLAFIPAVPEAGGGAQRLLLLRVFGYQRRTEALFDFVAQRWRFHGPVQLIVGSDLAMRTVDPADFVRFLGGRLREQYVGSMAEVGDRVNRLDMQRDPDGRFRVNELYCLNDTWKATLQALLTVTDRVLVDVRGLSKERGGILFELEEIVGAIPSDSIVLVSDRTTHRGVLEDTLRQARARARATGGAALAHGPLPVVTVDSNAPRELDAVVARLFSTTGTVSAGNATRP